MFIFYDLLLCYTFSDCSKVKLVISSFPVIAYCLRFNFEIFNFCTRKQNQCVLKCFPIKRMFKNCGLIPDFCNFLKFGGFMEKVRYFYILIFEMAMELYILVECVKLKLEVYYQN